MFTSRITRFVALTGAAGWLMLAVLNDLVAGSSPPYDASPGDWAAYAAGHHGAAHYAGLYGEMAALALAMVFVGLLCSLLRRAEGDRGALAVIALTAGVVGAATKIASGAPILAALYLSDKGLDGEATRVLFNTNGASFALAFIPNGVMMLALGAGILSYGHLPRWLGWFGIVTGIGLIAGAPFVQGDGPGFIGMLLFMVWNIAASVTLFVKWPSVASATAAPRSAPSRDGSALLPAAP